MPGKNNYQEKISRTREQNKKERFSIRKLTVGAASVLLGFSFLIGNSQQTVKADTVTDQTSISKQIDKQTTDTDRVAKDKEVKVAPKLSTFSGLRSFLHTKTANVPTEDADHTSATTDVNNNDDTATQETTTDTAIATGESAETATAAANLQTKVNNGQAVVDSTDFANAEAAKQTALTTAIKAGQDLLTKYQAQQDLTTNTNTSTITETSPVTAAELSAASDQIAQSLRELKDVVSGGTDTATSADNTWIDGDCLLIYDTDNQTLHVKAGEKGNTLGGGGYDNSISNIVNSNFYIYIEKLVFDDNIVLPADSSYIFNNIYSLKEIDGLDKVDTSNVTNMARMFSNNDNLTSLDLSHFDTNKVTDMNAMFEGDYSLTSLDLSNFDTSKVTDMSYMFAGDDSLTSLDLSNFDTSKVTDMSYMFAKDNSLTSLDLSNFDTNKVTDMNAMFEGDYSLTSLDLSNFDTSKVTDMSYMFAGDNSLTSLDLSNFNTDNIYDYRSNDRMSTPLVGIFDMFYSTGNPDHFVLKLGHTNLYGDSGVGSNHKYIRAVGKGTERYPQGKIYTSQELEDLYNQPAEDCPVETYVMTSTEPIDGWVDGDCVLIYDKEDKSLHVKAGEKGNTLGIGGKNNSFSYIVNGQVADSLDEQHPIEKLVFDDNVILSADASYKFSNLKNLKEIDGLDKVDTSGVLDMSNLFAQTGADNSGLTTLDLSNFDTSQVTDMNHMFYHMDNVQDLDVRDFDTSNVTDMRSMFAGDEDLDNLDLSHFNTSNVEDMNSMFFGDQNLTSLDLSNFDTSQVTDMSYMFGVGAYGASSLVSLDLSNFDTSSVTDMASMFFGANHLKNLDLSSFDTNEVEDMNHMFYGDSNLTNLDLSNFDTNRVTDMASMFKNDSKLKTLDLSNFDTSNVSDLSQMFENDSNLKSLDLRNFNTQKARYKTTDMLLNTGDAKYFILQLGHTRLYGDSQVGAGKGKIQTTSGKTYTSSELEDLYNQKPNSCPVATYVMTK